MRSLHFINLFSLARIAGGDFCTVNNTRLRRAWWKKKKTASLAPASLAPVRYLLDQVSLAPVSLAPASLAPAR